MYDIIELLLIGTVAVGLFTAVYKIMPFKLHGAEKPKFVMFPKYIAQFDKPLVEIESALSALEFEKNENGIYSRGKIYGDFSVKAIKLAVEVDEQNSSIKVYAPFFGILFDTGDIWQVTANILSTDCLADNA
jgi:hypothetical protein